MVYRLSTGYFNKLAQLKIQQIFPEWKLELVDKPDLQDETNNIGIEVTIAKDKVDGIFDSVWNEWAGKGITSNEFRDKFTNTYFKEKIIPDMEHPVCVKVNGNLDSVITKILGAIKTKSKKFNGYKKFDKNGLFIYCPEPLWEEQFSVLKQRIYEGIYPFDFFIISMTNKMLLIENNELKIYDIDFDKIEQLTQESLDFSQNH